MAGKKVVKIKRADGVSQRYHVGGADAPTTANMRPAMAATSLAELTLSEADQFELSGLKANVLGSNRPGKQVPYDQLPAGAKSGITLVPGVYYDSVRTADVEFDDGNMSQEVVGATGMWNGHPFIVGPAGNGDHMGLAVYAVGANPADPKTRPIGLATARYGTGIGLISEDLGISPAQYAMRACGQNIWRKNPELGRTLSIYPGVVDPATRDAFWNETEKRNNRSRNPIGKLVNAVTKSKYDELERAYKKTS